jgi:predicted dehydrogenase
MLKKINRVSEVFSIMFNVGIKGAMFFLAYKLQFFKIAQLIIRNKRNIKTIDIIGCGTYALTRHIPILCKKRVYIASISTRTSSAASNLNINSNILINDKSDYLLISSPPYLHTHHLIQNYKGYNKIYYEKPVCIDETGLEQLKYFMNKNPNLDKVITVGFNRRNAPAIVKARNFLSQCSGKTEVTYRVNFGPRLLNDMSDVKIGGGRLIGACCHYVDLIEHVIGAKIKSVFATSISTTNFDTINSILTLGDGSIASLIFTSESVRPKVGKEVINISKNGHSIQITDFKWLKLNNKTVRFSLNFDGSVKTWDHFLHSDINEKYIPLSDGIHATEITFAIRESIMLGEQVDLK